MLLSVLAEVSPGVVLVRAEFASVLQDQAESFLLFNLELPLGLVLGEL